MSAEIKVSTPLDAFRQALGKREAEFIAVLGDEVKWRRFCTTAVVLVGKNPKWLDNTHDRASLFQCCMHAAESGLSLDPNLGHVYFVPRWNKHLGKNTICFQMGYKGLLKLAYQSGDVASFSAECVYKDDDFDFALGTGGFVKHRPAFRGGEITHVWAMAKLKAGGEVFVVLPKAEIDKARKCSQSDAIWNAFYQDMCRKTALRRLCKLLHLCTELQRAIGVEEFYEGLAARAARPVDAKESLLALAHEKTGGGVVESEMPKPNLPPENGTGKSEDAPPPESDELDFDENLIPPEDEA
jgi:recombination protein RecT